MRQEGGESVALVGLQSCGGLTRGGETELKSRLRPFNYPVSQRCLRGLGRVGRSAKRTVKERAVKERES